MGVRLLEQVVKIAAMGEVLVVGFLFTFSSRHRLLDLKSLSDLQVRFPFLDLS